MSVGKELRGNFRMGHRDISKEPRDDVDVPLLIGGHQLVDGFQDGARGHPT